MFVGCLTLPCLVFQIQRQKRRELRTAALIQQDKDSEDKMQAVALEKAKGFEPRVKGKYSIWRKDYESLNPDTTLKLIRDQIILAKAYANIAKSMNDSDLYSNLIKQCRESQNAIGEAKSDSELHPRYFFFRLSYFLIR